MALIGWPVSSHRLHERAVRLAHADRAEPCTLLPFFTREGQIERVMVVRAERSELLFLDPTEVKLHVPLRGPVPLRSSTRVFSYEDVDRLVGLWHYDPWWVLTAPDAQYEPRSRILKQTNCVDSFVLDKYTVQSLTYSNDLRRVVWLVCKNSQGSVWKRFRPKYLPEQVPGFVSSGLTRRPPAWRLAPFWQADVPQARATSWEAGRRAEEL